MLRKDSHIIPAPGALNKKNATLKAVALVEIPFALWHIPDLIVQTDGQLSFSKIRGAIH
jgi:hypothetical protein